MTISESPARHVTQDPGALGLTVDDSGTVCLAGKPYSAFGVNSFTLVIRYIEGADKSMYEDQFRLLKKYDIPFIRCNFGGFWPDYYERFDSDPEYIINCMRDVVKCAEKYETGLICSLMWEVGSIAYHMGEGRSAMGDPESRTVKYAKEYTSKIVSEFKDSPAVWAWEIGNEYNLDADLCDMSRVTETPDTPDEVTGEYFFTSEEMNTFYREIGNVIRSIDPVRMISTGNGDMRIASKSLHEAAKAMDKSTHMWNEVWTDDTVEDFYEMCSYCTPDPIDAMCFHLQHAKQDENGRASFMLTLNRFGGNISSEEYFTEFANAARRARKALYFGEMGDMMWMEGDKNAPEVFRSVTDAICGAGIQLASSWQFSNNDLKATDEGIDGIKLNIIKDINDAFKNAGRADRDSYWAVNR